MMYSMYVKWRIAAIAVILVFLSLPNGMDLLHRGMFSLGAGVVPLWILPSGGVEPDDEGLSWSKFFLGWPTLVMYAVLATFVWWMDGVWWSLLLAAVPLIGLVIFAVLLMASVEMMEGTHNTCM